MWDLPGPGLEPVSPALAGGFLTTVPPGKSQELLTLNKFVIGKWSGKGKVTSCSLSSSGASTDSWKKRDDVMEIE